MTSCHDNCKTHASFTRVSFSHVYCTRLILLPVRMPNLISAQFLFKTHQTMTEKYQESSVEYLQKTKNTDNSVNRRLTVCSHPILVLVLILEEQKITFRQLILESNHTFIFHHVPNLNLVWVFLQQQTGAAWNESRNEIEMVLKITPAFN